MVPVRVGRSASPFVMPWHGSRRMGNGACGDRLRSHAAHDMGCAGRAFARAFQIRVMRLVWWRFERVTPSLHFVHTRLGGGGASRAFASHALNCAVPRRTWGLATPPSSGDGNSVSFFSKNESRLHSLWFRVLLDFPKNTR